ncbi:hypothetical protein OTERR_02930 [Oryzomicrobium terrae]|uniref:N-acetyltransferase domain-containing protein n=1 Tax=Oryzomicrobium terrae TaxID=1735038 RepID=A0A5C1E5D8_9RHOO|nr:GNAT family N-acetyltransferase [Oryzomicrobium terrae]QEL63769.1 hypothetical protein OTERR_02930 [Oryzomicrobium terrae]
MSSISRLPAGTAIRPMDAADIGPVAELARRIWQATYPGIITQDQIDYMLAQRYNATVLAEELGRDDVAWDVLWRDGARIGFAATLFPPEGEAEAKLDKLYLDPTHQRGGLGGALIAHVAERAAARGCQTLVLAVNKHNAPAIGAYRKHGFTVRESVTKDIGHGFVMDDFIMARNLSR